MSDPLEALILTQEEMGQRRTVSAGQLDMGGASVRRLHRAVQHTLNVLEKRGEKQAARQLVLAYDQFLENAKGLSAFINH